MSSNSASDSGTTNTVQIHELRAAVTAEFNRFKSDIENIFARLNTNISRTDLTFEKVREIDPLLQQLRDRVTTMEVTMKSLTGGVDDVDFEAYKRTVDRDIQAVKDAAVTAIENKLKPVLEKLESDRKELEQLRLKVNDLMVRWSIAIAVIVFFVSKGVDVLLKFATAAKAVP